MTTKKKFEVETPEVVLLRNGRYAFRAPCPWEGKNGKQLVAFKFCSAEAYHTQNPSTSESEHVEAESEQIEVPEEPEQQQSEQLEVPEEP